jgi:putative sterol carrier protein
MAHFESDTEVYDQLGGILNNLVHNSARREQLRQADAVVQFAFRAPDATVTLDVRAGKPARIHLGSSPLRPDVVLSMDADTGRALLNGEVSAAVALARGEVRTKGSVNKVLRVIPATVKAHEVEADLEPEPEPEPKPKAAAPEPAAPAEEAAAPAEEPVAPEAAAPAEEAAAPAADEAAPEAPGAAEGEVSAPEVAETPEAPESAETPASPDAETPPAEASEVPTDAAQAAPVDPPAEAEAPAEADRQS